MSRKRNQILMLSVQRRRMENSSLLEFDGPLSLEERHTCQTPTESQRMDYAPERQRRPVQRQRITVCFPFFVVTLRHRWRPWDDLEVLEFRLHPDIRILLFTNPSWRFDSFDVEFSSFWFLQEIFTVYCHQVSWPISSRTWMEAQEYSL